MIWFHRNVSICHRRTQSRAGIVMSYYCAVGRNQRPRHERFQILKPCFVVFKDVFVHRSCFIVVWNLVRQSLEEIIPIILLTIRDQHFGIGTSLILNGVGCWWLRMMMTMMRRKWLLVMRMKDLIGFRLVNSINQILFTTIYGITTYERNANNAYHKTDLTTHNHDWDTNRNVWFLTFSLSNVGIILKLFIKLTL